MTEHKPIYVISLHDHADGNAYATGFQETDGIIDAYEIALKSLLTNDHVCITLNKDLFDTPLKQSMTELAPHSLILSSGKFFPLDKIVNKL